MTLEKVFKKKTLKLYISKKTIKKLRIEVTKTQRNSKTNSIKTSADYLKNKF